VEKIIIDYMYCELEFLKLFSFEKMLVNENEIINVEREINTKKIPIKY
jgi:hypothetical protein